MDIINKLLPQLHIIFFVYAAYGFYTEYDNHSVQLEQIVAPKATIEDETVKLQKKLKEINEYKKNIETSKKRVQAAFENIQKVQKQLPSELNDTEVLYFFNTEATGLNVKNIRLSPAMETPQGFYIAKDYEFAGEGTFLQFAVFFERIASSERLYNVKKFKMVTDTSEMRGRYQLVKMESILEAYKYNKNFQESSGIEEIEQQFKNK